MTPVQAQLNQDLPEVPEFKEVKQEIDGLKEGQDTIIRTIEEEREFNESKFAQGAEKFEDLYQRMDQMKEQIAQGFKKQEDNFNKYISETKDTEISKLTKKLEGRDYIKSGIIITLVGGILLYVSTILIQSSVTPETEIRYIKKAQTK